ncbi:MAG TPA: TetR/AcrR family transcriptional regulator, partial [Jiangellaceae bacterium]|nr:TetR/AcrR family transcriptional regulator [Jiangellaceae bacterium]
MARFVADSLPDVDIRERIVAAGLVALSDDHTAELTVRRVAKLAGSSTMCIYTKFGGRTGMVEAVYRRGFEMLRDALSAATRGHDPAERIVAIATAYRRFALDRPALYALMFERPLPDFDPSPSLRTEALGM